MADAPKVRFAVADGVARIVLCSPQTGNAIDPQWAQEFRDGCAALGERDDLRVVVMTAEGKAFCVGGDVGFFAGSDDPRAALHALASDLHAGLLSLAALDAPVVVAAQGVAAGAGLSLVLGADIAIAGRSATFTVAYTGVGLSPDGGSSYWLPRLVGHRRAADLMLSNRRFGAEEAAAMGVLTEAVDDDALEGRVGELVAHFAAGPTAAYGAVKRLLASSARQDQAAQLADEADAISELAGAPTGREGVAAFMEKRRPSFPVR
jgi:2-(1,2-epoxy-1,2-dihydrophenyl)acetyl-CoA isomerase